MICRMYDDGDFYVIQTFDGSFCVHFNAPRLVLMQTFTYSLAEH